MTGHRHRGFALMMAVFIIVTLAAVGLYALTVSTGQLEAQSQDERGALAYQAARTGLEWGAYQLLRSTGHPFETGCAAGAPVPQTLTLGGVLGGYFAEVTCTPAGSESEGGQTVQVFRVRSTGCTTAPCGVVGPTYAERQLELTLAR